MSLDQHDIALFPHLQKVMDVELKPLNPSLPDAFWVCREGNTRGISFKQVGEVLSSLSAVEEQLSRDMQHVDRLDLIVTGVMVPVDHQHVRVVSEAKLPDWVLKILAKIQRQLGVESWWAERGKSYGLGGDYRFSYLGYRKFLDSLTEAGLYVWEVPTRDAQVSLVQALYEHSQTDERTTFRRTLRTKMDIPDVDPMQRSFMALADSKTGRTFVGPENAAALVNAGLTIASVVRRPVTEIAEVKLKSGRKLGPAMAMKLKEAIGE